MGRQFTWIFLGVSAAFFLFITGLTGYRIDAARRANADSAQDRAMMLSAQALLLAAEPGGFGGAPFRDGMKRAFEADGRLLLAAVRSEEAGFLWLMARDLGVLESPAEPTPDWRGTPVYAVARGTRRLVTRPLSSSPDAAGVVFDGVFVVLDRDDLYPVLRDDLYLFLAFLLASGIFMLLTWGYPEAKTSSDAGGTSAGTAPAATHTAEPSPVTSFASRIPADAAAPHGRSLASPATGLTWAEHLPPRLKAEIGRAAAADQDLSFARIVMDLPPDAHDADAASAEVARQLHASFPVADLLFESGPGTFSVIMPDQDLDLAVRNLEALRARVAAASRGQSRCTISIGVSARGGRLIEENTLLVEAEIASTRAAREGGNRVVGFRADPARFRAALGGV
jgi:hypothetical protein